MTTINLKGLSEFLSQADQANGAIADAVEARAAQVLQDQSTAETMKARADRRAAIAARAREQKLIDETAARDEEAAQLRFILQGAAVIPAPTPAVVQPDPTPTAVMAATVPPQEPAPEPTPTGPHPLNVRHWTLIQWLLAVFGAIIGIVVARITNELLFGGLHGVWQGITGFLWLFLLAGFFFFLLGAIGAAIDEWRRPQDDTQA